MEGRVFLLGLYKNYDELEENLSMPELLFTLEMSAKTEFRALKFQAALQGVDLDDPYTETKSLDDVRRNIAARNLNVSPDDAVLLAHEIGLGYETV